MEKNFEQRGEIKFCCKAGFMAAKTCKMFVKAFGDLSVSHATVFRWHNWFVGGQESLEGAEWSLGQEQQKQMKTSLGWQLI